LGFEIYEFRVYGLEFRVQGHWIRVQELACNVRASLSLRARCAALLAALLAAWASLEYRV